MSAIKDKPQGAIKMWFLTLVQFPVQVQSDSAKPITDKGFECTSNNDFKNKVLKLRDELKRITGLKSEPFEGKPKEGYIPNFKLRLDNDPQRDSDDITSRFKNIGQGDPDSEFYEEKGKIKKIKKNQEQE